MASEVVKSSVFKRFNILAKLVCVFIAFIIWIYVTAVESPDHEETVYNVPVKLVGVSTIESNYNLSVFSGYELTVDLTVKGQLSTINKYTVDDYSVTADISSITKGGRFNVDLHFDMPNGVTLSSSSAKTADMYVDEKTTTTVSVLPKLRSVTVAENYELGTPVSDTDTVMVSGPKNLLEDIDYAAVYLDVGSISSSVSTVGQLTLVNLAGEDVSNPFLKLSKPEVKVSIPLYTYKELSVSVPTKHGIFTEKNSTITVSPEKIAVKGDPSVLEGLSTISTTVIDETKITSDSTVKVGLVMPDNVSLAEGEVSNVSVSITHKGTEVKTIVVDDIDVKGAKGRVYSLLTSTVSVNLRGIEKELENIDADNISISVDISGFTDTTGTVSVPLTITVKDVGDSVYVLGDYSIQVKLS